MRGGWVVRVFSGLVRLVLPKDMVRQYGEAQVEAFADLFRSARTTGFFAVVRLVLREGWGLMKTAYVLRREVGAGAVGQGGGRSGWLADGLRDLMVAVRSLRKSPGYVTAVVLILALGAGSVAAVFTVANGVLIRPLPYPSSEELVFLWTELDKSTESTSMTVSPADFLAWREGGSGFESLEAHNLWFPVVSGGEGDTESILGGVVTPGMFDLLGFEAQLGRTFTPDEGRGEKVVVLSHGLWSTRFGSDPAIVGQGIRLNGSQYEVVGVLPSNYRHPDPHRPLLNAQLFAPFDMGEWTTLRGVRFLRVVGRLAEEATVERASSQLNVLADGLSTEWPVTNRDTGVIARSFREEFYGAARPGVILALVGAGLLFLIVCANVANLVLARSLSRRREFAVRASLGAGRLRIARQILIENGVLALAGGVLGLAAVGAFLDVLRGLQGRVLPVVGDIRIDGGVALFSVVLLGLTTLVLGLIPLGEFFRTPVQSVLREEGGGTRGSRRSQRLRSALVVGEIAIAAALVVGAGLLGSSFRKLASVGPGFDAPSVLTAEITAPADRYEGPTEYTAMYEQLAQEIRAVPGIAQVSYASQLPLLDGNWTREFEVTDQPSEEALWPTTEMRMVSPGYFTSMGIGLIAGRVFSEEDRVDGPPVVIVNETLANRHWPPSSAVGRRVRWRSGAELVEAEVVGVVADVLDNSLDAQPDPFSYYPFSQSPNRSAAFALRTTGPPSAVAGPVRAAIRAFDGSLPINVVESYETRIMATVAAPRLAARIAAAFSVLALTIAGLGIYGVVAYAVRARTREIGIRSALGAQNGDVTRMVLATGFRLALIGGVLGLILAVAQGRLLSSLLFQTSSIDLKSYVLAPGLLIVIALLASYLPTRRALSLDPVRALRSED